MLPVANELINCPRCGQLKEPHKTDRHLCVDCVKAENNRVSHTRRHNNDFLEVAEQAGLEIWERQPAETDREYQIWLAYRDAYPSVRPSYRLVATQLDTTYNVVKKVALRWKFSMRLQAWAKYVDELTLSQRTTEIKEMNATHVSLAQRINDKLSRAIEAIDPLTLEPRDIKGLLQLSSELERKARLDKAGQVEYVPVSDDDNPELKKVDTKLGDMQEIVDILGKAGVINPGAIGIKKTVTTTTEVVAKEEGS